LTWRHYEETDYAADGFLEKPERRRFIPVRREQKVNDLTMFIHRPIEVVLLTFDLDIGLVHPPADSHRAGAAGGETPPPAVGCTG